MTWLHGQTWVASCTGVDRACYGRHVPVSELLDLAALEATATAAASVSTTGTPVASSACR